jgi:hypothetical protein
MNEQILKLALVCTTSKEAWEKWSQTPNGETKKIFWQRMIELATAEAKTCMTPGEAWEGHDLALSHETRNIFRRRVIELVNAEAQACKTSDEAWEKRCQNLDNEVTDIFWRRWVELKNAETATQDQTCTTSEEAKKKCDRLTVDSPEWEKAYTEWEKLFLREQSAP